jgi:hypothetical protein
MDIHNDLRKDTMFIEWFKEQSPEDQAALTLLQRELFSFINDLRHAELSRIADKLDELAPSLNDGIKELQDEIKNMENFIKVTETLGKVIGLISRVVSLAAGPGIPDIVAAVAGVEKKAAFRSADKISYRLDPSVVERLMGGFDLGEKEVVDSPPENKPVAPVAVEEVLHGIELTPESLIITVATGGRTEKDSFYVEVKKRYTYSSPYLVTVFRIKSDDSKGNFEPIRISFSRRDLGLEGSVELHVLNRIGNTSQHRLLP